VLTLSDAGYQPAGSMMVLIALTFLPQLIGLSYERAALAAGDPRGVFVYSALCAVLQIVLLAPG